MPETAPTFVKSAALEEAEAHQNFGWVTQLKSQNFPEAVIRKWAAPYKEMSEKRVAGLEATRQTILKALGKAA